MTSHAPVLDAAGTETSVAVKTLRTIAVATDGTTDSDAALVSAQAMAPAGVGIEVVSVCEILAELDLAPFGPVLAPPIDLGAPAPARERRIHALRGQFARTIGAEADLPIRVAHGALGPGLAALVDEVGADLVVLSRGHHGAVHRFLGEERVLKVLRASAVPVLVVGSAMTHAPKRCAVAIDFSVNCAELVRAALMVCGSDAVIHLVHVKPEPLPSGPHPVGWLRAYENGVRVALHGLKAHLHTPASENIDTVVLEGETAPAIADYALQANIDVIVTGAQGHGFFSRLVIGGVTTDLLRSAPCAVLAVPTRGARHA